MLSTRHARSHLILTNIFWTDICIYGLRLERQNNIPETTRLERGRADLFLGSGALRDPSL